MEIVLACDLGGTNLRMAAINADGSVLYRTKYATPRGDNAEQIVDAFASAAEECIGAVADKGNIKALSAAVPSGIDYKNGIVVKAPNLPALDGFRLAPTLTSRIGLPVILENDANAAAIGEQAFGAAKGFNSALMVTLGTGVGGGVIIDGKILRGADGMAGELGHICVEPFGYPCGCGSRGCIEQYSSATAVVRMTRELEGQYPQTKLRDKSPLTSADIYEAGLQNDELALEVFRLMGFYLGVALASFINVINPEIIIIGGGASAGWDLFLPHTKEQIQKRSYGVSAERVKIVRAELGDDAGILGAAHLAFTQ